jgi:hypothetical protein
MHLRHFTALLLVKMPTSVAKAGLNLAPWGQYKLLGIFCLISLNQNRSLGYIYCHKWKCQRQWQKQYLTWFLGLCDKEAANILNIF